MKLWSISLFGGCLLTNVFAVQNFTSRSYSGYSTVKANNVTIIEWQNHPIYHGKPSTVSISPDGQSVAWVEDHLVGHITIDGAGDPVYAGRLYMAHAGGQSVLIPKLASSRGYEFPEEDPDIGVVYHPKNLKWDSTSQYLYFTTLPWPTRAMLWQITPGATTPRGIVPLWDYRLLKQAHGADWLEAYETNYAEPPVYRDWHTTSIYTPAELASDKYVQPTRKSRISKGWPKEDWPPSATVPIQLTIPQYYQHIHDVLYEAWDQPGNAADKHLVTTVALKIARNGSIADASVKIGSGNKLMDESVLTAARKVPHLAPPPATLVRGGFAVITVNFQVKS